MLRQIYIACSLKAFSPFSHFVSLVLYLHSLMRVHFAIRFSCEMFCYRFSYHFFVILFLFQNFNLSLPYKAQNHCSQLIIKHCQNSFYLNLSMYSIYYYIFFFFSVPVYIIPSLLYYMHDFVLFIFTDCARFLFSSILRIGSCCCCCLLLLLLFLLIVDCRLF